MRGAGTFIAELDRKGNDSQFFQDLHEDAVCDEVSSTDVLEQLEQLDELNLPLRLPGLSDDARDWGGPEPGGCAT
ncbi:MAG TPA: hypothetical protein VMK12_12345 [Anaeromyxobacteraceae bacterium]|nr:hypothetical protein [Anaeromyxobacteraceae bacterium]